MAEPGPWWRWLTTVRARATLAATVIVGLALAATAIGLVVLLQRSLVQHVDDGAEVRALDVAALVGQNALPTTLAVTGEDGAITQVVDDAGRVLAATAGLPTTGPIATFRPAGPDPEIRTVEGPPLPDHTTFRVLALRADAADGLPVTIYVAASMEPAEDAIAILRGALAAGTPVLLALVAITAWILVGRALHPVEAIRAQAAAISERSLHWRVPVPPADDEVSRLATTMNTMLARLETAALRQRRFVADASHELQTPLASARTDLEVALAHPDRTDWRETASQLLAENRRMERLVRDLLFLARADAGAARPPAVPVDLDDVVLSAAAAVRTEGGARVDTSRVSAAAVLGRRDDLGRAVRNLLDNAARYASSLVEVELTSDDHVATLVVADDGPGIAAGDRDRVFERFGRLDDARGRERGGTGLGLAIVKEIIEGHGGTVSIQGASPGARFVVQLPAA